MLDLKMVSAGDESKGKIEEGGSNSRRTVVSSEAEYLRNSRNNLAVDHFINVKEHEAREVRQGEHYYGSSARVSDESKMSSGQRRNMEPNGNTGQNMGTIFLRDSEMRQRRSASRSGVDEGRHVMSDVAEESISGMNNVKVNMSAGNVKSSNLGYINGACFNIEGDVGLRKKEEEGDVENESIAGAEGGVEVEEIVIDDAENKDKCKELEYLQVYKDEYKDVHNKETGEFRQNAAHHKEQSEGNERNTGDHALLSDNEDGIRKADISSDKQKEERFEEGEEAEVEEKTIEQEVGEEEEKAFVKTENESSDIKKEINYFGGDHFSNSNETFLKNYRDVSVHVKEDIEEMEKKKKLQLINKLLYFKNDDGLANHIRSILGSESKRYAGDNKGSNNHRDPNGSVMNSNDDGVRKLSEQLNVVKTEAHGDNNNGCGKRMITKDNWMNMKTLCLNYIRILKRLTNEWSETDKAFEYHFANLLNNENANILENYLCCFSNIKIHVAKSIFIDSIIECIEELEIMKKLKLRESKMERLSSGDIEQNEGKKMSKSEFQKRVIEELDNNMTKEIIEEIHHLTLKNPYCSNYNMSSASVAECENNMPYMYTGMNKHVSFNNDCNSYDFKRGQEFNKKNNMVNSFNPMNVCNRSHSNHSCNSHFTNYSNCNANAIDSLIDSSLNQCSNDNNNNSTSYNCMDISKIHNGNNNNHNNNNNNSTTTPGNSNFASNCNNGSNINNGFLSRDFFKSCNAMHTNNCTVNNELNTCKKNCSCAEENILNKLNVSIDYNAISDFNSHNYLQEAEKMMERYKCLNKLGTKDNKSNTTYKLCSQAGLAHVDSSNNMNDSNVNCINKNTIATNNTSNICKGSTSSSNMNVNANNTDGIINTNKNMNNNSNNAANAYLHLKNFFIEQENKMNRQQKCKEMDSNTNEFSLAKFLQIYPNLLSIFDDKSLSEIYSESELKELKKRCIKKTLEKMDITNSKEGDLYPYGYKIDDEDICDDREKSPKVELDPRLLNTQDITVTENGSTFCNNPNNNLYQNIIGNTLLSSSGSSSKNMSGNNNSSSINNAIINANLNYLTSNLQKLIKKRKLQETNVGRNSNGGSTTPNPNTYDLNYLLMCNPNILKKLKMGLLEGKNVGNTANMNNVNINNGGNVGSGSTNSNNGSVNGNNNSGGGVGISGDDFRNKACSFDMNGNDNGSLNSKKALLYRQSILNSLKNMKGTYDQNQEAMNVSRRNSFNKVGETISPNILLDLLLNKSGNNVNKGAANNVCDNALFSFGNNVVNAGNYGNSSFPLMKGSKSGINVNCNMSGNNVKTCYELAAEFNQHLLNGQKTEYSPNVQDLAELAKNHGDQTGMGGTNDGSSAWHMKDTKEGNKNLKNAKLGLGMSHSMGDHIRNDKRNNSSSGSSVRSSKGNKGENKLGEKPGNRSGPSNICSSINTGGVSESGVHNSNLNPNTLTATHLAPGSVVNGVVVGKLKYEMPEGVNPNDDKVKGVYFSKSPRGVGKWNAYFQIANNKRLFTSFSVSKYGYNEARNLSILKRTQWEKEYKYQGDVKSGDTGRRGKKKTHGNVSNKNNNVKNANINNVNNNISYNDIVSSGTAYTSEHVVTVNNDRNSSLGKTGFKNIGNSESSISNFNRETTRGQMDTKNNKETRNKSMKTRELWKSGNGNENDDTYYSNGEEDPLPLSKRSNANNSAELFQQVCTNVNNSNKNVRENYNNLYHVYNRYYRNGESGKQNFEGQDDEAVDESETDNPLKHYRKNSKNDTESFASIDLIRPNLVAETSNDTGKKILKSKRKKNNMYKKYYTSNSRSSSDSKFVMNSFLK